MKSKTMEYQTARDLPFAEAGTKVELSLSEGCIPMSLYNIKDCEVTISKEFIGQLLCEGWIEPIKPREFWIEVQTTGTFVQTCKDDLDNEGEVIKVREVTQ